MAGSEATNNMTAKTQSTVPQQNNPRGKPSERRSEGLKRSLLRKIRIKIGGKVADIFTW
ncbi:MAG: hypothetical protein WBC78_22485 [Candidatus Sulfotelmatobacter sp.]